MAHHPHSLHPNSLTSRSFHLLTSLVGICGIALGCSSSENPGSTGAGVGGSAKSTGGQGAGTGGSGANNGGVSSTGGAQAGQGGSSQAGSNGTGGNATTGGSSAAGTSTATGGAVTATGGSGATATGGTNSSAGGALPTGGSATAATGGAATGGSATGGATSSPVTPKMVSATDYQLTMGSVVMDVNPAFGARVSKLTYTPTAGSAVDIIQPYTCNSADPAASCNNNQGSTFWTSPQSSWDGVTGGANGWPPVAAIDTGAYAPAITNNHLILTGSADATLGASVTKDFSADSGTGWITVTYTINATKAIQVAPWQITRVPRTGLVFFPIASLVSNTTSPAWTMTQSGGFAWIDDSTQSTISSGGPKIIADGGVAGQTYTWLAYARGGNLLLLKYPNLAASAFATGESDTEVYPGTGYIELEAQGAYTSLATGANSTWTVQWRVVPIPSTVTVGVNSTTLTAFAQQQAAL